MDKSAFFVSDLHLGARYESADPRRAEGFEDFVRSLIGRASHLFLLGDLFEFWMEYRYFVPKDHFRVLSALRELQRSGVEIHYLCGNHDFNLGTFFQKEIGIETHEGPLRIELQGKKLLLLHGDGMNPDDKVYRWVRRVLHHPLANGLYRLLHPDLGMAIALNVGRLSRQHSGNVSRYLPRYEEAALKLLRESKADILMHGHIHAGFVKNFPEGIYVNTGEWLKKLQYVEMTGGECFLRDYNPSSSRLMASRRS